MLIGMVLVISIVLMISLWPGQSVDQRHRNMFKEDVVDLPITTPDTKRRRQQEQTESGLPKQPQKPRAKKPPQAIAPQPKKPTRIHTVTKGETLSSISQHYYGTAKHANKISDANQKTIKDKDKIRPSMKLIIPYID